MFFGEGRIPIVQRMILADNETDRRAALAKLLPLQREDFYGIFKAMNGDAGHDPPARPAAARVPAEARGPDGRDRAAGGSRADKARSSTRSARCCAASSSCTSSTRCSATAASASGSPIPRSPRCRRAPSSRPPASWRRRGSRSCPEIMIPLVGHVKELRDQKAIVDRVAAGRHEGAGRQDQVPRRHDDRGAARRRHRRRDRRRGASSSPSAPTT